MIASAAFLPAIGDDDDDDILTLLNNHNHDVNVRPAKIDAPDYGLEASQRPGLFACATYLCSWITFDQRPRSSEKALTILATARTAREEGAFNVPAILIIRHGFINQTPP